VRHHFRVAGENARGKLGVLDGREAGGNFVSGTTGLFARRL
jgi:hypothetical protein